MPSSTTLHHPNPNPDPPIISLLTSAHAPSTATSIFSSKIQHKPLLLLPSAHTDQRALRRHVRLRAKEYYERKKGVRPLSAREKRERGLHCLRRGEVEVRGGWGVYKGLNRLWEGYVLEILGLRRVGELVEGWEERKVDVASVGSVLVSMEMVGAWVQVKRHRDVGRVGVEGVVIRDTKYMFVVVMEGEQGRGRMRKVQKRGGVFEITVCVRVEGEVRRTLRFEVLGSAFEYRPVERAGRKFKWRQDVVEGYV